MARQVRAERFVKTNPKLKINLDIHNRPDYPVIQFALVDDNVVRFYNKTFLWVFLIVTSISFEPHTIFHWRIAAKFWSNEGTNQRNILSIAFALAHVGLWMGNGRQGCEWIVKKSALNYNEKGAVVLDPSSSQVCWSPNFRQSSACSTCQQHTPDLAVEESSDGDWIG
jgi:hypothetical protein